MTDSQSTELTDYEQRRENRLEKFLNYLDPKVTNATLNDEELQYLETMHRVNRWQNKWFTPDEVVKMLMDPKESGGKQMSYKMAYQLRKDSDTFFGRLADVNKDVLRVRLLEQIDKATQLALSDTSASGIEKAEIIAKNAERKAKIAGLYNNETNIDPDTFMPAREIHFVFQGSNNKVELISTQNNQNNNGTETGDSEGSQEDN